jgi:cell division protein FtsL
LRRNSLECTPLPDPDQHGRCREDQRDAYVAEWSRLQLEQAWLADTSQVEGKARDRLGMELPESINILVVEP